jgi:hypothetical protein
MATITAEAKLYTGIRCWCVDKNISAALTSSFTLGNQNQPSPVLVEGVPTVYAGVKVEKLMKFIADIEVIGSVSLTNERYKTYGAGNNVITAGSPRVINNTRNWKMNAAVACKFPTYVRIDIEKLQLPEGTDCIVQLEEGWLLEGDYPGSFNSPSPRDDNFVQFRTPWYGVAFLNTSASVSNTVLRIKQLASSVSSAASITALPIFNPGRFAALFGGVFTTTPNASKTARTGANLYNSVGPIDVGGNPILATILKIKQLASAIASESNFASEFDIVQVVDSAVQVTANISADATKYKGLIDNFVISSTTNIVPVRTASGRSQNNVSTATIFARAGKLKAFNSTVASTTSLSATITHIQRSPRWLVGSSYGVSPGNYTIPISDVEFITATVSAGSTQLRRYTNGTLSQDAAGVLASDRRSIDVGAGSFWVVSDPNNDVVDWGAWGTSQNPPKYIEAPVVAVCKTAGDKFALYSTASARIKFYNTSGTELTVYDNIATNMSTPRFMQIQTNGSTLLAVATNGSGIRVMRYSGSSWSTNTFNTLTDADFICLSSDGLMMAVSNTDENKVYILTRISTLTGFSLVQTINQTYSNIYLDRDKQFLFLDNKSYLYTGGSFQYVRDVGYPAGAGAYTFGSTSNTTQIISNTGTGYYWQ